MNRYGVFFCLLAVTGIGFFDMAMAQNTSAPAPATVTPALPPAAEPAQDQSAAVNTMGYFPMLPPARGCTKKDIVGYVWRIRQVYERPSGPETRAYSDQRYQYMVLKDDSTYKSLKSAIHGVADPKVREKMDSTPDPVLQQYVLQDTGILYFYNDGQVVDRQACFIVAAPRGQFFIGQMLWMPPADDPAVAGGRRVVKIYQKINVEAPPRQMKKQPKKKHAKGKKRKKGKAKRRRRNRRNR